MPRDSKVVIHGDEWKRADIQEAVTYCRHQTWHEASWTRRDALVERSGTIREYIGQAYDPTKFKLVRRGWSHDHCEICWWRLCEEEGEQHSVGYTDGRDWICSECYHQFIELGEGQQDI